MKKILAFLCAVLIIVLAGCSLKPDGGATTEAPTFEEFSTINSAADVVTRINEVCNTTYFEGDERLGDFTNSMNIPALNFSTPGANAVNQKILADLGNEVFDFFDKIKENHYVLKVDGNDAQTAVITHKWRSFNMMTVIEVDLEFGFLYSEAYPYANLYYYDRANDKELSFDEFLTRLGTTKEALFNAFSQTEPDNSEFSLDSVQGVFPDTDLNWHVILNNGEKFRAVEIRAAA